MLRQALAARPARVRAPAPPSPSPAAHQELWRARFLSTWGPPTAQHLTAVHELLGGSWRALVAEKHVHDRQQAAASGGGWVRPSQHEIAGHLRNLARAAVHAASSAAAPCPATPPPRRSSASSSQSSASHAPAGLHGTPPTPYPPHRAPRSQAHTPLPRTRTRSPSPSPAASWASSPASAPHAHAPASGSCSSNKGRGARAARASPEQPVPALGPGALGPGAPAPSACEVVYVLDGSGSVSEADFAVMRAFVAESAPVLCAQMVQGGHAHAGKVRGPRHAYAWPPVLPAASDLRAARASVLRLPGGGGAVQPRVAHGAGVD